MKQCSWFLLLWAMVESVHAATTGSREVLGPVVGEKRVYTISVDECVRTFKKQAFQSSCVVRDESLDAATGEVKLSGGTGDFTFSRPLGGRDSFQVVTFGTFRHGYQITFSNEGGGGISKPVALSDVPALVAKVIEGVGSKAEVYVYMIQK